MSYSISEPNCDDYLGVAFWSYLQVNKKYFLQFTQQLLKTCSQFSSIPPRYLFWI